MAGEAEPLRIYFLDVGQGDCTFVVPPADQGRPVLFDCSDEYVAERFVANHGITDLGAVVVSHLDYDHVKGMLPFLLDHFEVGRRVGRLVLFPDRVPKAGRNQALRDLMAKALEWEKHPPHEGFVLKASQRDGDGPVLIAESPGDWKIELVLPWVGTVAQALVEGGNDPNACSAVLRITRGGTSVLVGGDAPLGSWERLEPERHPARVIRVPHHGGEIREHGERWHRFEDLYQAVSADLAVISAGTNNAYGHPFVEHATAAHRSHACRLLCTQLTPRCHDDPMLLRNDGLAFAGGVEWPYRHRAVRGHSKRRPAEEVPCAGSVVAWIGRDGSVQVEPRSGEDHDRLVSRVDRPLCQPTTT